MRVTPTKVRCSRRGRRLLLRGRLGTGTIRIRIRGTLSWLWSRSKLSRSEPSHGVRGTAAAIDEPKKATSFQTSTAAEERQQNPRMGRDRGRRLGSAWGTGTTSLDPATACCRPLPRSQSEPRHRDHLTPRMRKTTAASDSAESRNLFPLPNHLQSCGAATATSSSVATPTMYPRFVQTHRP